MTLTSDGRWPMAEGRSGSDRNRPLFLRGLRDCGHHLLHAQPVDERRIAVALLVNGLDELEVLIVAERLPGVLVRVTRRAGNLPELRRHVDDLVRLRLAGDANPERVRELVGGRAVAPVDLAPVAA